MLSLFNSTSIIIDSDGSQYSLKEILAKGDELFSKLPSRSIILLLCKNQFEAIFFYINCIERGAVPILMDASADKELIQNIIEVYCPLFVFAPSQIDFTNYTAIKDFKSYSLFQSKVDRSVIPHPELAILLSTSGTTGSPKLVRLTYSNLISNSASIASYLNLNISERAITSLPMNYSFGLSIINSHLSVGASIVITSESITQRGFWDIFNRYNVTSISGVPYTFEIIKKIRLLNVKPPSLKTITQAGGKLSNDLIQYFSSYSNQNGIRFYIMYGQTEGTARLSYLDPIFTDIKTGSIGKPIPGGKFLIKDTDGNQISKPGQAGELIYHGPNVMMGYAECKKDLELGDMNKGELGTGDIAYFDEDGFYYITGRVKRFVKLFGNRVNLDEIESLLLNNGIESACIGEENKLIVFVLKDEHVSVVKQYLTQRLTIHPSIIKIGIINEIPKNTAGKTLYSKLNLSL